MGIVGVGQLQHDSATLLARLEEHGEPFLITRYGQPIAALIPVPSGDETLDLLSDAQDLLVRELVRNTRALMHRVENDNETFSIIRRGEPIAILVPVAPTDVERFVIAAAPELLKRRWRAETAGAKIPEPLRLLDAVAREVDARTEPQPRSGMARLVFAHIQSHLADSLEIIPALIHYKSSFTSDLEADSLDLYVLVETLQDSYGVKIPDEEAVRILTVGDAVEYVLAYGAAPILEAEARRILNAFDDTAESRTGSALLDAYGQLSAHQADLIGTEASGSLTMEQFGAAATDEARPSQTHLAVLERTISAIVDVVDHSGQQVITREAFVRWMNAVAAGPQPDAPETFDHIDARDAGVVTAEELIAAVRTSHQGRTEPNPLGRSVLSIA